MSTAAQPPTPSTSTAGPDRDHRPGPGSRGVVGDQSAGVPAGVIGARFHRAVADLVVDLAGHGDATQTVALSGGVFQNALLLRWLVRAAREGFRGDHASLCRPTTAASHWAS